MQGSVGLLDLKIRVIPPHLAQRLNNHNHVQEVPAAPPPPAEPPLAPTFSIGLDKPYLPMLSCVLCMLPLVVGEPSGCLHLALAPFTIPVLIGSHMMHKNSSWVSRARGLVSLLMGNSAAVLSCSAHELVQRGGLLFWMISTALGSGVVMMLLLMNKGNIVLVMISTASAVVVCCLSCIAPILPTRSMSYRCYQSAILPILWLFYQAVGSSVAAKKTVHEPLPLPA